MILLPSSCFEFIFCSSFPSLVFSTQRSFFSICCKAGLVVLNSLNFCLSGKFYFSIKLNESLAGQSIFGCKFFLFITLNISCQSLLTCRVSVEKSADSLIGVPSYVICCFPCCFLYFIFVFNFCQFYNYVSWCVPPWIYPAWVSLCFQDLVDYFLSHIREVFSCYLFKRFLRFFLSLLTR